MRDDIEVTVSGEMEVKLGDVLENVDFDLCVQYYHEDGGTGYVDLLSVILREAGWNDMEELAECLTEDLSVKNVKDLVDYLQPNPAPVAVPAPYDGPCPGVVPMPGVLGNPTNAGTVATSMCPVCHGHHNIRINWLGSPPAGGVVCGRPGVLPAPAPVAAPVGTPAGTVAALVLGARALFTEEATEYFLTSLHSVLFDGQQCLAAARAHEVMDTEDIEASKQAQTILEELEAVWPEDAPRANN